MASNSPSHTVMNLPFCPNLLADQTAWPLVVVLQTESPCSVPDEPCWQRVCLIRQSMDRYVLQSGHQKRQSLRQRTDKSVD